MIDQPNLYLTKLRHQRTKAGSKNITSIITTTTIKIIIIIIKANSNNTVNLCHQLAYESLINQYLPAPS